MKKLILISSMMVGLFYTGARAQWVQTSGAVDTNVTRFAVSGSNIFAATNTGYNTGNVVVSTDNGTSWSNVGTGLPSREIDALAAVGSNLFVSLDDAGIYLSTNNDSSWTHTSMPAAYIRSITAIGSNLFAGDYYYGVYRSTDNGTTWTQMDSGLTALAVNVLIPSGSNLFDGTSGGGVFLSTNNGTNWTAVNTGFSKTTYGYIDAMTVSGTNLFAGTYEAGVFLSTNNGANWTAASNGLPMIGISYDQILAFAASGKNIFVAPSGGGVYLSTNDGTSWTSVNTGLKYMGIKALAVNGGYLFAGGDSSGVWRRPLSEMITAVKGNENDVPKTFSLSQNYPNPFNPTTVINYQVPASAMVTLKVYDVLGREVATLINGRQNAGYYNATFNAANLPSGVYFYRLEAGTYHNTRKLLLLK
jgi:photosystem II stability/assembly factor-like uncharacterized protein